MEDDTSTALSERERAILDAEIRGSAAEFLGWLSGLTPPTEREAIPPEMRAAFDKMCGRLATAVATVVYCREDTANRASTGAPDGWKLVPIKPTPRMDKAGVAAARAELVPKNGPPPGYVQIGAAWDAMLAAAPPAPCSPVKACPRPVNTAPEGKTAAQCIADGECGCDASPVNRPVPDKDSPAFEVLLNRVAAIIDPAAFADFDNLSPTEREIWNDKRGCRQGHAGSKAREILTLLTSGLPRDQKATP